MSDEKEPISPQQIRKIQDLAGQLAFGSISLIFQDGKLIQLEKNEKIRINRTEKKKGLTGKPEALHEGRHLAVKSLFV